MKTKYEWREGARAKVSVEIAAKELKRIHMNNKKRLTADLVVTEASNPKSPIHGCFDWDDSSAAHEYRLDQARSMIRKVAVVYHENKEPKTIRLFVQVEDSEERFYTTTARALSSADMKYQVLDNTRKAVQSALRELTNLIEFSDDLDGRIRTKPLDAILKGIQKELDKLRSNGD